MMKDLDCDRCGLGLTILAIVGVVGFLVLGINMTTRTKNESMNFKIEIDLSRS